jgi:hypothetical protein
VIPFNGSEAPLIATNPIVYSSSHAIMKSCVDTAFQKIKLGQLSTKFVAFGRYGDLDMSEDQLITEMVVELAEQFDGVHATGKDLKKTCSGHPLPALTLFTTMATHLANQTHRHALSSSNQTRKVEIMEGSW